jgi:uncharacterized protein
MRGGLMKRSWMAVGVALAAMLALAGCEKMKPSDAGVTPPVAEATPPADVGAGTPAAGTVAITTAGGQTVNITVEIASTDDQKKVGLMNREGLGENAGMWFDFSDRGMDTYPFYMKDTLINLDWVYVDNQGKVVFVKPNNIAKDETPYKPPVPFQYVLEIKGGEAEKLGIKAGDAAKLQVGPAN